MQRFDPDVLNSFSIDAMPNDDLRDVARLCGIDVAKSLLNTQELAGSYIYIPKNIPARVIRDLQRKNPTMTVDELATSIHVTRRTIYRKAY